MRKKDDPDHATQSHADQMERWRRRLARRWQPQASQGSVVEALAIDTTGSSVIPVDEDAAARRLLSVVRSSRLARSRRDHRRRARAQSSKRSTGAAASTPPSGASPSCCTGCGTIPRSATAFVTALEHCDMVAAMLCGIDRPGELSAQHLRHGPQMDVERGAGRASVRRSFCVAVDPLLAGVRDKTRRPLRDVGPDRRPPQRRVGRDAWACAPGIPIPVGAFDAHWDAIGAGVRLGDVVNVIGTSTCIMAIGEQATLIPGVCGVVPGSVHPQLHRHRSGPLGDRRHLRRHRARARNSTVADALRKAGELSRRPDRAAAADLGQRRPHGAGESGAGRRHVGLASDAHGAGRTVRRHRRHGVSHARDSGAHGGARRARSIASSTAAAFPRRTRC